MRRIWVEGLVIRMRMTIAGGTERIETRVRPLILGSGIIVAPAVKIYVVFRERTN
jgi:hypothetical protein